MPRAVVSVRPAVRDDIPTLVELWQELRDLSPRQPRTGQPALAPEERLAAVLEDAACRVVVATVEDLPVGMTVLSKTRVSPLLDASAVQMSLLVVSSSHRKHGVGRVLVGAALAYADEVEADEVVVSVLPTLREANRFYAQLGFSTQVVRRGAPVSLLRRRLAATGDRGPLIGLPRRRATRPTRNRVKAALAGARATRTGS